MVKGNCMSFVKYIMFSVNILFVILSLVLIMIGIFLESMGVTIFADTDYLSMPVIIILIGCFMFTVSFFGCYGTLNEKVWALLVYGGLMLIICVFQIGGIVYAYMYRSNANAFIKQSMQKSLAHQQKDHVKVWDQIQKGWQCCGVDGPKDYRDNDIDVPASCCPAGSEACTEANAFEKGCYVDIIKFIDENVNVFGGVGGLAALGEVTVTVIAFCLVSAVRRERNEKAAPSQPMPRPRQRRYARKYRAA